NAGGFDPHVVNVLAWQTIHQIYRALGCVGVEAIFEKRRGPPPPDGRTCETEAPGGPGTPGLQGRPRPAQAVRAGHCGLDVFLARPHHLDRAFDLLRDLNGTDDTVDIEPASEPAADEMIVDDDLVQWQSRGLRCRRMGTRQGLGADPDFAAILAHMSGAI